MDRQANKECRCTVENKCPPPPPHSNTHTNHTRKKKKKKKKKKISPLPTTPTTMTLSSSPTFPPSPLLFPPSLYHPSLSLLLYFPLSSLPNAGVVGESFSAFPPTLRGQTTSTWEEEEEEEEEEKDICRNGRKIKNC